MKEHWLARLEERLCDRACKSEQARRRREDDDCPFRTPFQVDRDRILHSSYFRKLQHKTQVFLSTSGSFFRTRLTHTLEVAQIARTIARALELNEDLTEAIALGHDLGHTPFGHEGEKVLNELVPGGFRHNLQSLRVVRHLEKNGRGLNLTLQVEDGIVHHSKGRDLFSEDQVHLASTLEGQIVRLADCIAYINHDIDDAIVAGLLRIDELPRECIRILGYRRSERIATMVGAVIEGSREGERITMTREVGEATDVLRKYLFDNLYCRDEIRSRNEKASRMLRELFFYYEEHPAEIQSPEHFEEKEERRRIADYLASLADQEVIGKFEQITMPRPWILKEKTWRS